MWLRALLLAALSVPGASSCAAKPAVAEVPIDELVAHPQQHDGARVALIGITQVGGHLEIAMVSHLGGPGLLLQFPEDQRMTVALRQFRREVTQGVPDKNIGTYPVRVTGTFKWDRQAWPNSALLFEDAEVLGK